MGKVAALRGQARRHRMMLTGQRDQLAQQISTHMRICDRCTKAKDNPFAWCDQGWELAKAHHRALRAVERYDEDHPDNQLSLLDGDD